MADVRLEGISKSYPNGFQAVKNIDLEIGDKEFMVLVGPSGCGKTTTLRMIAGLEEVTSGNLYIGNKIVNDVAPKDRNIAMVFQNYALYPHMSVFDNIAFGLKLRKVPKQEIKAKVESVAKILGIEELLERKPKMLSGGQRQRVALGRSIVREPEVFLMDEPLSNLDAKLRVQMRTELIKLHNDVNSTFIYVTHDQTEAMTMGSRICVMNKGEIQQIGTPKEIYNKPANVFVAGFVGAPQMNFLPSKVMEKDGAVVLEHEGVLVPIPPHAQETLKSNGYLGEEVLLGVRPEDAIVSKEGFFVKIELIEMLGSGSLLHYNIGPKACIASVSSDLEIAAGDEIYIAFDPEKMHLFDLKTEQAIV